MGEQTSIKVSSAPAADESATLEALRAAAETAPTTTEEARQQAEAKAAEAKADETKTEGAPERPEWLPEKFKSVEDMAKAYSELEKKVGKPADEAGEKAEDEAGEKKEGEGDEKPAETPKASEVVSKLNENFAANGQLTDEDYALAESIGHDRATVDAFIAGQKALADQATQRITDAAGGKESMDTMFAWASSNLKPAEIDEFNKSFEGADVNAAVIAMEQLKERYEVANGRDPQLLKGKPMGSSVDVYQSWAQVTKDMQSDEYRKDAAFRAKVQAKLGRSNPV